MIKKMRKRTLKLMKLEALSRRIHPNHPKRKHVENDFAKLEAGYKGEMALNYFFERIRDKEVFIFHDLRLPIIHTTHYFQIDTLVVTSCFIVIVEVKNIAGNIYFDHIADQIIRTYTGESTAFQDPVNQGGRQSQHLSDFLQHKSFPFVPIEHLACITNSSSVISFSTKYPEKEQNKVIRPRNLLEKLNQFKTIHIKQVLSNKDLKKLTAYLLKNHTDDEKDILAQYNLNTQDIATGVQCPSCLLFTMHRRFAGWRCKSCKEFNLNAHIQALNDYSYLLKPSITNKEARNFLHLHSVDTTRRILQSTGVPSVGKANKYRYILRE